MAAYHAVVMEFAIIEIAIITLEQLVNSVIPHVQQYACVQMATKAMLAATAQTLQITLIA